jgi:hypothetical protein
MADNFKRTGCNSCENRGGRRLGMAEQIRDKAENKRMKKIKKNKRIMDISPFLPL